MFVSGHLSLIIGADGVCMHAKNHPLFVFSSTLLKSIALEEITLPDYVIVDYAIFTACRLIPEVEKDMANIKSIPCIYKNTLADWMNLPYTSLITGNLSKMISCLS